VPEAWTPAHAGPALVVCMRVSTPIAWDSAAEAELADRELNGEPCSPECAGYHFRCWTAPGRLFVRASVHNPGPRSLSAELLAFVPPPPQRLRARHQAVVLADASRFQPDVPDRADP
jgi:hypothetical protein